MDFQQYNDTTLQELIIIYDADGTVAGEVVYYIRKAFFGAHCAACDITHGPHKEKPDFQRLKQTGFGVPIRNIHRDEMDVPLRQAVRRVLPAVVAKVSSGTQGGFSYYQPIMGPKELDMCGGDVENFKLNVISICRNRNITVPSTPVCSPLSECEKEQLKLFDNISFNSYSSELSDDAVVPE